MRILVHICCAPCFTTVHRTLSNEGHEIVGYFFNPNIHPYQEFLNRLHCLERYTALKPVEVIYDKEYDLDKYLVGALKAKYDLLPFQTTKSKPAQPAHGFQERIEVKDALQIRVRSKDENTTTTENIEVRDTSSGSSVEGGQNHEAKFKPRCGYCIALRLAKTAERAAGSGFEAFTTTLLESKYQPHDYIRALGNQLANSHGIEFYYKDFRANWKESIKISKELELYRQQYCGCIFSEYERFGSK